MTEVRLNGVEKAYGDVKVLHDIKLDIQNREFVVFVGPSGCGKSTLLRSIAGLEDITQGQISIGGRDVTYLEPADRGVAMVFQSYALYPHMTVYDNIAFGLKMAKKPKAEIDRLVQNAARILQLEPLLQRKPKALSGGQRQRVAIGRAIVHEPEVFLFDEPLSNLDASLRVQMRVEIAKLHADLKATMIYVTHDQVEAMTLADKIVVLNKGRIEQVGSPLELYRHPRNRFVAGFIGSPQMNFLPVTASAAASNGVTVTLPGGDRAAGPGNPRRRHPRHRPDARRPPGRPVRNGPGRRPPPRPDPRRRASRRRNLRLHQNPGRHPGHGQRRRQFRTPHRRKPRGRRHRPLLPPLQREQAPPCPISPAIPPQQRELASWQKST